MEAQAKNCCKIINCGLELPKASDISGMQRVDMRDAYRKRVLPKLMEFKPDMIFISAGFDAHRKDSMNFGYVGMIEDDYEWLTQQLVKVANTCCEGRIVSVLEGGYKIHGGLVSPFARSVASHVRGLVDGSAVNREGWDQGDADWESEFERNVVMEKERKRLAKVQKQKEAMMERAKVSLLAASLAASEANGDGGVENGDTVLQPLEVANADLTSPDKIVENGSVNGSPPSKRARKTVDYKTLLEEMEKRGE